MEGPTSFGGSRNRLTCLTLQEHDDDELYKVFVLYFNINVLLLTSTSVLVVNITRTYCIHNLKTAKHILLADEGMVPKHNANKQQNHIHRLLVCATELLVCATELPTSTRTYITQYDAKSITENL